MANQAELWNKHFSQFVCSNDPVVERLMAAARQVEIAGGQQVFMPGSSCNNYLLMLEGCVKTQLISESGREVLLYHVRSGESCVLTTSCLLSGESYPAEGVTEEKARAFAIPANVFHYGIENSSFFRQFVFTNFAKRLANVMVRMDQVVFGPIDLRLSRALLEKNKPVISITHQELAAALGTVREVVSRHLKRYEAYGWVELKRGTIQIKDATALKKLSVSE